MPSFVKLLSKIFGHKSIYFEEGEIKIWNVGMVFIPTKALVLLHSYLKKNKTNSSSLLYDLGRLQAYNGTKLIMKFFGIKSIKETWELFAEQSQMIGTGTCNIIQISKKKSTVRFSVSSFLDEYDKQSYPDNVESEENYLTGLISGVSEAIFNLQYSVKRVKNEIGKRREYLFELFPNKEESSFYKESKKTLNLKQLMRPIKIGRIIKNVIEPKFIEYTEEGSIKIGKCEGILITNDAFSLFVEQLFIKDKKSLNKFGMDIGDSLLPENRFRNPIDLIGYSIDSFSKSGWGELRAISIKKDSSVFELENSSVAKHLLKNVGAKKQPRDIIICGYLEFVFKKAFKKSFKVNEVSCIVQGKSERCAFIGKATRK